MPSSFTTPLEVEYIDGQKWKVTKEFDYLVTWPDPNTAIRVPVGFVTDFASIPRVFWDWIPPTGAYGKAAVVHDYLYVMGGKGPCAIALQHGLGFETGCGATTCTPCKIYTKADSDKIFYDAMGVLGVGQPKRWLMYQAVRKFGKGNFGKV